MGDETDYVAKRVLYDCFPAMRDFAKATDEETERFAAELALREWRGVDTSYARTRLLELRWRTGATSDVVAAGRAMERLRTAMADPDPPNAETQDAEGSFATGTEVFFLRLDRSTDQLLAREWPGRVPPRFLDQIDDPIRTYTYLEDLAWCDVRRRGVDTRKELNLAISVIARLAARGGQCGYLAAPGTLSTLESFARCWRDPDTGFYGVTYVVDDTGGQVTTKDLSLTFHMVRYLPHLVENWQHLVETLLDVAETSYPQGRVDPGPKMYSDHNNYDVAEILRRGWRRMTPNQRVRASALIKSMLDWCLSKSVTPDGEVIAPDTGDMVPDAYYFCAAFLDTIGYFDPVKRFWTATALGEPGPIRRGMAARLGCFNPRLTVVGDTLERLGLQRRPYSSAVL